MYRFEPSACTALGPLPAVGLPRGMPFLLDGRGAPVRVVNRWLASLPTTGVPAPASWLAYAGDLAAWVRFLHRRGLDVFEDPAVLRDAVAGYHAQRRSEDLSQRLAAASWNRAVAALSRFYAWAEAQGLVGAVPFSYTLCGGPGPGVSRRNLAMERQGRPLATLRWLERDYLELFVDVGLGGLGLGGQEDPDFAGRHGARNTAAGHLAASSGLRAQELSHLLVWEIPLPAPNRDLPVVALAVPGAIAKGHKARTTWISSAALDRVQSYLRLERPLIAQASRWSPVRDRLVVTEADAHGGRVNGRRLRWSSLTVEERRRLVAPGGGSALWALRGDGGPMTDWEYVFSAASARCRRFEPRFPAVSPHVLRHSFAVHTLRWLLRTHLGAVARALDACAGHAAWALALRAQDPLLVLRDLLGHASVATTEIYLQLIDTTRLFTDTELGELAGSEAN